MLPATILRFCSGCGRRIVFDWVVDYKSDREDPSYLHIACYEGKYGKTAESSDTRLPFEDGEKG